MSWMFFWQRPLPRESTKLKGHGDAVTALAFSPDGKSLASGSRDKSIRLWNMAAASELRKLQGHEEWIGCVSFSPNGQTLASCAWESVVRLWDVASGKEIHKLQGDSGKVYGVCFSPDGRVLVSGGDDGFVFWDVATGQRIRSLPVQGPEAWVRSLALSPDGKTLAAGLHSGRAVIWDAEEGKELHRLWKHAESVPNLVAFSPDGKRLLSADTTSGLGLCTWEVATAKLLHFFQPARLDPVYGGPVALSPDASTVVLCDWDKAIHLCNIDTGRELGKLKGQREPVTALAFSPDGRTLASGSGNGTVLLWTL